MKRIITILTCLCTIVIHAQDSPETERSDGSKSSKTKEIQIQGDIPDRLMTPDRERILEEGIFDLSDSLYKEPGFSRVRRGGTNTDLVFRGFQKDNLNFLMDGQRMYGACPNRMDPPMSHLDLGAVERFEVVRGPYDVKNPGSLGGTVQVITKRPRSGMHSSGNTGLSSFGGNFFNADASYGGEKFSILVGGSYSGMNVYKDGNGNRFTSQYNDYLDRAYLLQNYTPLNAQQTQALQMIKDRAPGLHRDYSNLSPSNNRYRYSERNGMAYTRRGGWTTLQYRPTKDQELEVQFARQEQDGVLYPYLLMDANYDHSSRARTSYKISNLTSHIKEVKWEAYTSFVDHLMTDKKRCSSTSDPFCFQHGTRDYGMSTSAKSQTSGAKAETTFQWDSKSKLTLGLDGYTRNWNTDTTNRSRHFLHPLPPGSTASVGCPSVGSTPIAGNTMQWEPYRIQNAIPNATTTNLGGYADYKRNITERINLSSGLRYDYTRSYAGIDRSAVYDVYHRPSNTYLFRYLSYDILDRRLDREVYVPSNPPRREAYGVSGYLRSELILSKNWTLNGGIGHAIRPPDPSELYFAMQRLGTEANPDLVGNPHLANVKNSQVDAGAIHTHKKVRLEFNSYFSRVQNHILMTQISKNSGYLSNQDYAKMIALQEITNQDLSINNRYARTYRSIDAQIYGGEFSGLVSVHSNWYLLSTVSYTRGINVSERRELPEISPLRGSLALRWDIESYFAEWEGVFAGVQNKIDPRLMERRTPGYGIANLKLGWNRDGIRLILGVRNVLDRYFFDHLSYSRDFWASGVIVPEPGRMYYATLQWNF